MNELLHFYSGKYLPTPHPACTEHGSGLDYGGKEALFSVTTPHCWQYSLLHHLLVLCPLVPSITPFHRLHFVGYLWAVIKKSQHHVNGLCQSTG